MKDQDHTRAGEREPEDGPTLDDVAQREVWEAAAFGGCLFAAERLLYWFARHPEALGAMDQYHPLIQEFSRRLDAYSTGWTKQEGFSDPGFEPHPVKTLDDAFFTEGAPRGRLAEASKASLRMDADGIRHSARVYLAVTRWLAENPEKGIKAAFDELAGSEEFPGESAGTIKRRYYEASPVPKKRPEF